MTTSAQYWTVETGLNEYGWFESHAAARAFARLIGGGTIHEYHDVRLAETKEITCEEYEELSKPAACSSTPVNTQLTAN